MQTAVNRVARNLASAALVSACRLAITATALHWLVTGDDLRCAVASVTLVLTLLPERLVRDPALRGPTEAVIAVLLAAHVVLGMQGALYETSEWYDTVMHGLGSGAIAGLLILASRRHGDRHRLELSSMPIAVLAFSGTLSVGTLWELFEYAIDRTGLFSAQRGLQDTMIDLLADAIGAALATALFAISTRLGKRGASEGAAHSGRSVAHQIGRNGTHAMLGELEANRAARLSPEVAPALSPTLARAGSNSERRHVRGPRMSRFGAQTTGQRSPIASGVGERSTPRPRGDRADRARVRARHEYREQE